MLCLVFTFKPSRSCFDAKCTCYQHYHRYHGIHQGAFQVQCPNHTPCQKQSLLQEYPDLHTAPSAHIREYDLKPFSSILGISFCGRMRTTSLRAVARDAWRLLREGTASSSTSSYEVNISIFVSYSPFHYPLECYLPRQAVGRELSQELSQLPVWHLTTCCAVLPCHVYPEVES